MTKYTGHDIDGRVFTEDEFNDSYLKENSVFDYFDYIMAYFKIEERLKERGIIIHYKK